jgi:hypothetical protein
MSRRTAIFALVLYLAALPVLGRGAAAVTVVEHLNQGQAIVTGQREETRGPGIARAFGDVLAKVSGDPRLIGDPRVAAMAAETFVTGYSYRDRMAGVPIHDEQGTRDRPYDLTVDFDPERIDSALRSLGHTPWGATRPQLVAFIRVTTRVGSYLLASDGLRGRDQRESLEAAAGRFGVPVLLPSAAALDAAGLAADTLAAAEPARLDTLARATGGDLTLVGSLSWSDEALGWISEWRLGANGEVHRWGDRGGNFDQAFRRAVGGAAQILSGNGRPD